MKTIDGESRLSILPSQFVSYMRPTVGVDHTSVWFGSVVAVGPHVHFTIGSRLAVVGGWYWHDGMQPPSSVPPSSAHVTGAGRHRPATGNDCVQLASGRTGGAPPSLLPRLGSQYCPGAQSLDPWHAAPGTTHDPKTHTDPDAQQVVPQSEVADAQHVPVDVMHTPPLQSDDVVHPASGRSEGPLSVATDPSTPPSSPPPPPPPLLPLPLPWPQLVMAVAAAIAARVVR
jgi:hypothetical protein